METAIAKHVVLCDNCSAQIGEHYPESHASMSVHLFVPRTDHNGDAVKEKKQHHFCNEACMASHLNKRAAAEAASKVASASVVVNGNSILLNIPVAKKK